MPNDFNLGNAVKQLIWTGVMFDLPFLKTVHVDHN
jgi:hypothetical protein